MGQFYVMISQPMAAIRCSIRNSSQMHCNKQEQANKTLHVYQIFAD